MSATSILSIEGVSAAFTAVDGSRELVLEGITFEVVRGEVVGVVGEAGAGKSMLVRAILGLLPESASIVEGDIYFEGRRLSDLGAAELRALRGVRLAPILPNARRQLNPVVRVGDLLAAVIRSQERLDRRSVKERAVALLSSVGIPDAEGRLESYPHELSGGMAQRVCIALALVHDPILIVADEPTNGLDVTVQRQVLDLMRTLVRERRTAQLIVTRDLGIVAQYCSRVAVLHRGRIVEEGLTAAVLSQPQHAYTKRLVEAAARTGGAAHTDAPRTKVG